MDSLTPLVHKSNNKYPLIVAGLGVLTIILFVLSIWAVTAYFGAKDSSKQQIDSAVTKAEAALEAELTEQFESEQNRLKNSYQSSSVLGSIRLEYPRDWSLYLDENETSNTQIEAIFHPGAVRAKRDSRYALRLRLVNDLYSDELGGYQSEIEDGELRSSAVTVNGVNGVKLEGSIGRDIQGVLVLLPLRDKTIRLWSESTKFSKVFNDVLASLSFTP